jgi:hypothetical protein
MNESKALDRTYTLDAKEDSELCGIYAVPRRGLLASLFKFWQITHVRNTLSEVYVN